MEAVLSNPPEKQWLLPGDLLLITVDIQKTKISSHGKNGCFGGRTLFPPPVSHPSQFPKPQQSILPMACSYCL